MVRIIEKESKLITIKDEIKKKLLK